MELDAASLAIGRIERALSRLERAAREAPSASPQLQGDLLQNAALPAATANPALEAEVRAVIAEMDRLIAEAERG